MSSTSVTSDGDILPAPRYLLCVVGPTAGGKTDVALAVAEHYQTEILAADSRQIFKQMDIGTNKPTPAERARAAHHLIDVRNPTETFTVADYEREAMGVLTGLFAQHQVVVCAAGTGFYLQAVERGIAEVPPTSPEIRDKVAQDLEVLGLNKLLEELAEADPACFAEIDRNNPRRITRALEVIRQTGQPFSAFKNPPPVQRPFQIIKVGLDVDRRTLHQRIEARTERMFAEGLVEEVTGLLNNGLSPDAQALHSIGYREVVNFVMGRTTLAECRQAVARNTKDYARRQQTWFRKDTTTRWMPPQPVSAILRYFDAQTQTDLP